MASEMVLAYGENGLEPTPFDKVVMIDAVPLDADNCVIPATVRWMTRLGGHTPTKLRRVLRPGTRLNRGASAYIEFECTPFVRYETDAGPVMGDWMGCRIRQESDACDPIFSAFSQVERARMLAVVEG